MKRATLTPTSFLPLVLFLGGCLSFEVPEKFLILDKGFSEIKAITPDEAKLWVREFNDPKKGDFNFWSDTLKSDFVQNRGYTLIEERKVKDKKGRDGLELLFEVTSAGAAQRYLVTLFVFQGWLKNTIRVVEFVAPKPIFDGYVQRVREAISTLTP